MYRKSNFLFNLKRKMFALFVGCLSLCASNALKLTSFSIFFISFSAHSLLVSFLSHTLTLSCPVVLVCGICYCLFAASLPNNRTVRIFVARSATFLSVSLVCLFCSRLFPPFFLHFVNHVNVASTQLALLPFQPYHQTH